MKYIFLAYFVKKKNANIETMSIFDQNHGQKTMLFL